VPEINDNGAGRRRPRIREGHKFSQPAKDDQGRFFAICGCGFEARDISPDRLAKLVGEHIIELVPDGA
jgi:hypothetical protein